MSTDLDEPEFTAARDEVGGDPAFAAGVALHQLVRSWGVHPYAVLGEGVGAVAAAHAAGALDRPDATALATALAGGADLGDVLAGLTVYEPTVRLVSAATGTTVGAAELRDPAHWTGDGLAAALRHLADAEVSVFLELGLEGTLASRARRALGRTRVPFVGTRRPAPAGRRDGGRRDRRAARTRGADRLGRRLRAPGRAPGRPADVRVPAPALLAGRPSGPGRADRLARPGRPGRRRCRR